MTDLRKQFETLPFPKENFDYFQKVFTFVAEAKAIEAELFDWVGVYFKSSYLLGSDSTELVLGPYIGEETEHIKIPIEEGLCGLALREEKVVNMADVQSDPRHIACSLKTKSELIIPIQDKDGNYVAELDIDSNKLNAFSKDIEEKVKEHCKSFPLL